MLPDPVTLVAGLLLLVAVVGAVVPGLPGGLLAAAVVVGHYLLVGSPHVAVVVVLAAVALVTTLLDQVAGLVAADRGGAHWTSLVAGGAAGLAGVLVLGPVGLVVGLAGGTFLVELARNADARASARVAVFATAGVLASAVVQALVLLAVWGAWTFAVVFG